MVSMFCTWRRPSWSKRPTTAIIAPFATWILIITVDQRKYPLLAKKGSLCCTPHNSNHPFLHPLLHFVIPLPILSPFMSPLPACPSTFRSPPHHNYSSLLSPDGVQWQQLVESDTHSHTTTKHSCMYSHLPHHRSDSSEPSEQSGVPSQTWPWLRHVKLLEQRKSQSGAG